jgi:hypothetical protein
MVYEAYDISFVWIIYISLVRQTERTDMSSNTSLLGEVNTTAILTTFRLEVHVRYLQHT